MPISPAFSFKREFIMAKQAKAKKAVEKKDFESKRFYMVFSILNLAHK